MDFLEIYDGPKQEDLPTFLTEAHNISMKCMMDGMAYLGILGHWVLAIFLMGNIFSICAAKCSP